MLDTGIINRYFGDEVFPFVIGKGGIIAQMPFD